MRALLSLILLSGCCLQAAAESFPIGFERLAIVDRSRPGVESQWRTIETFLWYPAAAPEAPTLRATYFARDQDAPSFETARQSLRSALAPMMDEDPRNEVIDALLREPLPMSTEAAPANGKFPIVLVSAGLGSPPYALSSTCERIAGAGYLVVAVPTPPLLAGSRLTFGQIALETVMRDLEVTLGTIAERDEADPSRVALVGWSFGSVAHVLLQMRNPLVDAIVSLDGGVGYDYGSSLAHESIWFHSEGLTSSLLDVRALGTEGVPRAFDVLDLPREGPTWRLDCERLTHAQMTTVYGELAARASTSTARDDEAIAFVSRVVVAFLNEQLGNGSPGQLLELAAQLPKGLTLHRADKRTE